jgi:hypothetical protein
LLPGYKGHRAWPLLSPPFLFLPVTPATSPKVGFAKQNLARPNKAGIHEAIGNP